jgi:hypothetical protein
MTETDQLIWRSDDDRVSISRTTDGRYRIRCDRPGVSAVSALLTAGDLGAFVVEAQRDLDAQGDAA